MPSPWKVSPSPSFSARISSVNCRSMPEVSHEENEAVPGVRVLHDFGRVERRTEPRGMRVFAAQAAADAAVDHGGHRVAAQGIGVVLDGERRAAREPDARVVAGAGVLVDAIPYSHHSLSRRELFRIDRPELALPLELALAPAEMTFQPLWSVLIASLSVFATSPTR